MSLYSAKTAAVRMQIAKMTDADRKSFFAQNRHILGDALIVELGGTLPPPKTYTVQETRANASTILFKMGKRLAAEALTLDFSRASSRRLAAAESALSEAASATYGWIQECLVRAAQEAKLRSIPGKLISLRRMAGFFPGLNEKQKLDLLARAESTYRSIEKLRYDEDFAEYVAELLIQDKRDGLAVLSRVEELAVCIEDATTPAQVLTALAECAYRYAAPCRAAAHRRGRNRKWEMAR